MHNHVYLCNFSRVHMVVNVNSLVQHHWSCGHYLFVLWIYLLTIYNDDKFNIKLFQVYGFGWQSTFNKKKQHVWKLVASLHVACMEVAKQGVWWCLGFFYICKSTWDFGYNLWVLEPWTFFCFSIYMSCVSYGFSKQHSQRFVVLGFRI